MSNDGIELIPPKYDYIGEVSSGFAWVNNGGNVNKDGVQGGFWGLINQFGIEIIKPKLNFDTICGFINGFAYFKRGLKCGVVDTSGKEIIFNLDTMVREESSSDCVITC
jgi:hypothetical protein